MKKYTIINPDPTLRDNLMAFGFMCGEGWYPLIEELLDKIQDIVDKNGYDFQVTQIKEKYGTLRVYMSAETNEISDLIQEYEQKSAKTCEVCGKEGTLRNDGGWYVTRCDECFGKK